MQADTGLIEAYEHEFDWAFAAFSKNDSGKLPSFLPPDILGTFLPIPSLNFCLSFSDCALAITGIIDQLFHQPWWSKTKEPTCLTAQWTVVSVFDCKQFHPLWFILFMPSCFLYWLSSAEQAADDNHKLSTIPKILPSNAGPVTDLYAMKALCFSKQILMTGDTNDYAVLRIVP